MNLIAIACMFALLSAVNAAVSPKANGRDGRTKPCGVENPPRASEAVAYSPPPNQARRALPSQNKTEDAISIGIYAHIITAGEEVTGDDLDFTMTAKGRDKNSFAMKQAHRKGDNRHLNVYFLDGLENGEASATFPTDLDNEDPKKKADALVIDGCMVNRIFAARGPALGRDGVVLSHKVGHWLNLYHTFDRNSTYSYNADFVDDTPIIKATISWADGLCPEGRDSCLDKPSKDPIHNIMSYSGE
ncbi:hypothetical protein QQS21_009043 [Conoideocrella luteorostrata]|uniref:Peptidase M43 pregnancy-associated plasma-A domain-containing protein n=1 Tax=Conoideocrella luteorostrata TaxID=1105319 RepID=A0AAJ0CHU3_9HYPO|nr:hypothetical protein QQS21_009043 [Conoideocrella luteorostrata]